MKSEHGKMVYSWSAILACSQYQIERTVISIRNLTAIMHFRDEIKYLT